MGQIPGAQPGEALSIRAASHDGRQLLVTKRFGEVFDTSLWALDTTLHTATRLSAIHTPNRFAGRSDYGLSADGKWAAWTTRPHGHRCDSEAHVVATNSGTPPRTARLPPPYARLEIAAMTVGAEGRVTAVVARCNEDEDPRAIVTAAPGATMFRRVARVPSYDQLSLSQDGHVLAVCQPKRSFATVTVVVSEPGLKVKTARLPYGHDSFDAPQCLASDRGTATMTLVQDRRSLAFRQAHPRRYQRYYRLAGVTVGGRHISHFHLPWGLMSVAAPAINSNPNLEALSPSGGELLFAGVKILSQNRRTGRIRHFRYVLRGVRTRTGHYTRAVPYSVGRLDVGGDTSDRPSNIFTPIVKWDPFTSAIPFFRRGGLSVFNPRTLMGTAQATRVTGNGRPFITYCFLPTGRILVRSLTLVSTARPLQQRIYMSTRSRSRFKRLNTSRLGTVSSISCEAAGSGKVFFATAAGDVFEAAASSMDTSPLEVAP